MAKKKLIKKHITTNSVGKVIKNNFSAINDALNERVDVSVDTKKKSFGWVFFHGNGACLMKLAENELMLCDSWEEDQFPKEYFVDQDEAIKKFLTVTL